MRKCGTKIAFYKSFMIKKKRIGIDAHMLGDCSGGNETFYSGLLCHMQIPENLEIYLFTTYKADVMKLNKDFKIVYFKSSNAFIRNFIELPILCLKYKLDLLHTQYFIPFVRFCPVVSTIHDICFEHFRSIFTAKEYFRQKTLIPYAAKHSKKIFTVSDFSKKDISQQYKIEEKKIAVIYNSPKGVFKKLSEEELDAYNLKCKFGIKANYVLSVGNLQPRKNLVRLIKSFISLKNKHNDIDYQLVVVGKKAWMFDDVFKEACQKEQDIIFTGYVTETELVRLYNAATCFVYPSIFEGFGLPPIEAMACGTPVAVSNKSALPEVVGSAGVYFDPYDESDMEKIIYELVTNKEFRSNLIQKGFDQIKKYSWTDSANNVINEYEKILAV